MSFANHFCMYEQAMRNERQASRAKLHSANLRSALRSQQPGRAQCPACPEAVKAFMRGKQPAPGVEMAIREKPASIVDSLF